MKKVLFSFLFALAGFASAASLDLRAFTGSVDQSVASKSQTVGNSGVLTAGNGAGLGGTISGNHSNQSAVGVVTPTGIANSIAGGTTGGSASGIITGGSALGAAGSAYQGGALGASVGSFDTVGFGVVVLP